MGLKAEGAAQGYTVLGGIVLVIFAVTHIAGGLNNLNSSDALVNIIIGIALLLMVLLSFDASGFVHWKLKRNGPLLALFGLFSIIIVDPNVLLGSLNILAWLMNVGTLAGFMILIAGLLITFKGA